MTQGGYKIFSLIEKESWLFKFFFLSILDWRVRIWRKGRRSPGNDEIGWTVKRRERIAKIYNLGEFQPFMFSSLLIINYLESVLLGEPWNTFSVVLNLVLIKCFVVHVCWFDWSQGYIVSLSSDDMKLLNKKSSACSGVLTLSVLPCPSHTRVPAHTVLRIKLKSIGLVRQMLYLWAIFPISLQ